jgi:class 3 adenylate cyclase
MEQQIAYCTTSDGVRIAYATYGNDHAPPLVYIPEAPGQEAIWASPWGRALVQELARHRRLITYDIRGSGASQRDVDPSRRETLIADAAADTAAVADHLRLARFELFAGGPVASTQAVMYAGAQPGRVSKLVLFSPAIASSRSGVVAAESIRASYPMFLRGLGTLIFPSGPPEAQRWYSTAWRAAMSAEIMVAFVSSRYDLAPLLPKLAMPVLILHRKRSQLVAPARVGSVASLIPGARLVTLDGDAGVPYWDHEQFIDVVYDFLGIGTRAPAAAAPSGTAVILFVDIVDSTALTERMGDAAFRARSRALDDALRAIIGEAAGTTIDSKTLGDGVLATFPAASRAIDAALRCAAAGDAQGLPMHVGLHAGDVIREANNVFGGAVNIASRISALSVRGEVLVSDIVRGLARTSAGVTFEDRGEHALKGIEDPVRVFAVRSAEGEPS